MSRRQMTSPRIPANLGLSTRQDPAHPEPARQHPAHPGPPPPPQSRPTQSRPTRIELVTVANVPAAHLTGEDRLRPTQLRPTQANAAARRFRRPGKVIVLRPSQPDCSTHNLRTPPRAVQPTAPSMRLSIPMSRCDVRPGPRPGKFSLSSPHARNSPTSRRICRHPYRDRLPFGDEPPAVGDQQRADRVASSRQSATSLLA